MALCTCSVTITKATRARWRGRKRRLRRKGGLPRGLIARSLMIPLTLFLLACAAVYLGTIQAAFSALMRLSLRLVAEGSGRPGRSATISTIRCCCSFRSGCCSA